jgi:hypothetical protein
MTTESTLTTLFEIRRGNEQLATASITYVAVRDGRRCPVPDRLRNLIRYAAPDGKALSQTPEPLSAARETPRE